MVKKILCIVGTSTTGKSSVTNMLLNREIVLNELLLIPQTTCRPKRFDDDEKYLRIFSETLFEEQKFICKTGIYGTLKSDFLDFLSQKDNDAIALLTVGTYDLPQIKDFLTKERIECKLYRICFRLDGTSVESEKKELEKNLIRFFKTSELDKRRIMQHKLIEDCFYNEEYLTQNVDLILDKKDNSLINYLEKISELVGITISSNRLLLEKQINIITESITKNRILNRYQFPQKKQEELCLKK